MANRHIEHSTNFAYLTLRERYAESGVWVPVYPPKARTIQNRGEDPDPKKSRVTVHLCERRGSVIDRQRQEAATQ